MTEYYPKFDKLLEADGTPPQELTLIFRKMDGIARFVGDRRVPNQPAIAISADWIKSHPNDFGLIMHELALVIQGYSRSLTNVENRWIIEGIADYIRYAHYELDTPLPKIDPEKASYADSPQTTAGFFIWIEAKYDKEFVKKLNVAMRAHKYSDDFFKECTGKSLDALWEEYVRTLQW
jgi:hypothetical protein